MKLIRVIEVNYLERYKLKLKFNDGLIGIVDLENEIYGEIFEPLKDIEFFKKFKLDTWTVGWPNGADFAPEFLYDLSIKNQLEFANK